jgi:cytochrome c oxidase cbb3-type subunit 2
VNRTAIRAAISVAAVYGFFLIFAQFSFVELLRGAGAGLNAERAALGSMAAAGIAAGFLTAWRGPSVRMIRGAVAAAALAAALAPVASAGTTTSMVIAVLTGAALGIATVGLSALLPAWCGVAWVGLGTGLGYASCNLPLVFLQSPAVQAWIASGFAAVGLLALPARAEWTNGGNRRVFPMWSAVAIFTALVWMDSAAFFIIQHSVDLKSGTWGDGLLWRNAVVHLAVAIAAGWWLAGSGARSLPGVSWVLLAVAALAVNRESTRELAGWFYPAGVSLYSAALVAWPGWFAGADGHRSAAWRAAWLFAIAGWFGSANGIGMAQTLNQVPPAFVAAAGMVVIGVMVLSDTRHWRPVLAVGVIVLVSWAGKDRKTPASTSAAERGRQVYISEGCINCHSRYPRPGTIDEALWGPSPGVKETLDGKPVLIGNRRQGPDLTNIGARRSEKWLEIHFKDPRSLAPDSVMPSYAHLFADGRGQDLVRYLKESGVATTQAMQQAAFRWKPAESPGSADPTALYARHCAACHGAKGGGFGPLALHFARPPTNLVDGPFIWSGGSADPASQLARIIKFGIVGTDMPGHETLTDDEVVSLAGWLQKIRR